MQERSFIEFRNRIRSVGLVTAQYQRKFSLVLVAQTMILLQLNEIITNKKNYYIQNHFSSITVFYYIIHRFSIHSVCSMKEGHQPRFTKHVLIRPPKKNHFSQMPPKIKN